MRKLIFSIFLLSLFVTYPLSAQPPLTVDAGLHSRYIAHGYDIGFSDQEAFQLALYAPIISNIQFAVWSSFAVDRDYDNLDEVNLMLIWSKSFFNDSRFSFVPNTYIDYWFGHSKMNMDIHGNSIDELTKQGTKFNVGVTFPNLLAVAGNPLVLSYDFFYWAPLFTKNIFQKGGIHEIKLNYGLPLSIGTEEQVFNLGISTHYAEKNLFQSNPGWTNMAFHLGIPITKGSLSITPSIHYQWTWDKSPNIENEFWFGFNIAKSFGS